MTYINKFNSTSAFEAAKDELNKLNHFVAYDAETQKINLKIGGGVNDPSIVGDIVMYDKQNSKMVHCKPSEYSQDVYPDSQFTPIGVVIIPSSHTDDGKDVIMSLAVMSAKTPDVGISDMVKYNKQKSEKLENVYLRFGGEGRQLSGFSKNGKTPYIASCPMDGEISEFGEVQFDVISEDMSDDNNYRVCVFSNNQLKGIPNPSNPDEGYYTIAIDSTKVTSKVLLPPSPYTADGKKNPQYFQQPQDGGHNILADFNGLEINKKYLEQVQGGEDWKTSPTINNASGVQDFPYIQCCWRYHTDGTNQGDWYVPSAGEMGYVCARMSEIQAGYSKMREMNKSFIDLTDMGTALIGHWVSNYNSDIYGFGFGPCVSGLDCGGNGRDYYVNLSVAVCRVSLRF